MSRLRSAIGFPRGSADNGNQDRESLPSNENTRFQAVDSPHSVPQGDEISSASFRPSGMRNRQSNGSGAFLRTEREDHSLAMLIQSLQDRLDAHEGLFKKSYAREKDLIKENEELRAKLKSLERREKRVRTEQYGMNEHKSSRQKVEDEKHHLEELKPRQEDAWKQYIDDELNSRLRRPE